MKKKQYTSAITVFKRDAEAYPLNAYSWASLADVYEKNNDYKKALENYKKAYKLSVKENSGAEAEYKSKIKHLKGLLVNTNQSDVE